MVIAEYNITKIFDKKTGKIQHIITKDGETVYDTTFKLSKNGNTPFSPIDFLEAALNGEQIIITPQYSRELQNIASELHLLNFCKTDDEKEKTSFTNKVKGLIKKVVSLIT